LKYKLLAMACVFASTAAAQLSDYLGPGILTRGAGNIGTRSGQQVNLRFYADLNGVYDNGLSPLSLDSNGNLVQVNGLYGFEANIGAYGVHEWKRAQLGLDYTGNFRHYSNGSHYDGSNQQLLLGYTFQKSRRLVFDMRGVGGTFSQFGGTIGGAYIPTLSILATPNTQLFDSRAYYVQGSLDATYLLSARTSFTVGGDGFTVRHRSKMLADVDGYVLRGSIQHRMSRTASIGVGYEHSHYDFPPAFGEADINSYRVFYGGQLGRFWTISLQAGLYRTEVQGLQQVALDPNIAALLGVSSTIQTFYAVNQLPFGGASLTRRFRRASLSLDYSRTVTPGNGVYLTSRNEFAGGTYSYTGLRKVNFSVTAGENTLASLGQSIQNYRQFTAGTGMTYALTRDLHLVARYDARHQVINLAGYRQTSYRITFGLAFSPGDVPLSLW
jgi:hypothetical protein